MEHASVKAALEVMTQNKVAADEQNNQLAKQIEQMTASLATFQEAANGSEDEKQTVVARLQLQVNELQTRLAASQKDEEEYRRKWELLQDFSADELTRAQKRIDELTATCSELIKQVEDANNQEHVMNLMKEKEQLETRIHEMEIQYQATVDVVNNSSTMAIERENQMDDLCAKNSELEKKLSDMVQEKESLEKDLQESHQKQAESEATIQQLKEQNASLKEDAAKMKRRVLSLKNMEENMQDVEDLLQQREAQLKDVLERIKKAEKNSEFCTKEMKRYEAMNAELEHRMSNYIFREGQAGEVLEKIVEKPIDRPETLEKMEHLEKALEAMKEEKEQLEIKLEEKTKEEAKQRQVQESFKQRKVLPLKFFPMYPSLRPVDEKTDAMNGIEMKIDVEECPSVENEEIKYFVGRNPDVVRREEEERKRREEEERKRREEEERKRREEEERKRKEEEERKEEEARIVSDNLRNPLSPNPFDQESEEEKPVSPNPFDQESEEEKPLSPNPFDQESEEEKTVSPNPFDQESEEEKPVSPNPFDEESEEEKPLSPNPFDQESEEEKPASPNPFDQESEEEKPASPNPFDQESEEEKPLSPNPFDVPKDTVPTDSFDATSQQPTFDFLSEPSSNQPPQENELNPFAQEATPVMEYDLSSFMSEPKTKEEPKEKKSLWKSFTSRQKKDETGLDGLVEEPKKKWGLSDKQKGTLKSGMGKFSNLIKSAAVKSQNAFKSHSEEPTEFPNVDVGESLLD